MFHLSRLNKIDKLKQTHHVCLAFPIRRAREDFSRLSFSVNARGGRAGVRMAAFTTPAAAPKSPVQNEPMHLKRECDFKIVETKGASGKIRDSHSRD